MKLNEPENLKKYDFIISSTYWIAKLNFTSSPLTYGAEWNRQEV